MRFDEPVYFQTLRKGEYDSATGNYAPDYTEEEKRYGNVTSAGTEMLHFVYGEIKQGALVIRLQNHYRKPFDRIRIDEKLYKVDYERTLRVKQVFVVSEVQ